MSDFLDVINGISKAAVDLGKDVSLPNISSLDMLNRRPPEGAKLVDYDTAINNIRNGNAISVNTPGSFFNNDEEENRFNTYNLETAKNEFDDWYDKTRTPQALQLSAVSGMPYDEAKSMAANEPYIPSEFDRRFFDGDGNLLDPGSIVSNLFDIASQQTSSTPVRNYYEAIFANESGEGDGVDRGVVPKEHIDDGSVEGRTGLYMTADRYRQYRNAGLPGRPIEDIIDGQYYDKQLEMEDYGFLPYLPTRESIYNPETDSFFADPSHGFHNQASAQKLNRLYNAFTGLRRDNSDFEVFDLDGMSYSGNDFIDSFSKDSDRIQQDFESIADHVVRPELLPDGRLLVPQKPSPYAIPYKYNDRQDGIDILPNDTGAEGWIDIQPLVLSDGTAMRADVAVEIMMQVNGNQPDEGYPSLVDYGFANWGKPSNSMPDILTEKGRSEFPEWVTSGTILPWFVDMALGSVPYFIPAIGGVEGMSRATAVGNGMSSEYSDPRNKSYSLISEAPTRELADELATGSIVMPYMEHLWGPAGTSAVAPLLKLIMKKLGKVPKPLKPGPGSVALGAGGEALEEIPGNLTEEWRSTGLEDWYKDTVAEYFERTGKWPTDENGNPLPAYDSEGRPVYVDTPWDIRWDKFVHDAPESMFGAGLLGGGMGALRIPSDTKKYNEAMGRSAEEDAKSKIRELSRGLSPGGRESYYNSDAVTGSSYIQSMSDDELRNEEELLNSLLNSGELGTEGLDDIIDRYTEVLAEINDRASYIGNEGSGYGSFGGRG